jgi:iron complex transport system ATP-binding protein
MIKVKNLFLERGGNKILHDISFQLKPGSFAGLVGPNGSGKSSFLKCLYRALYPQAGFIYFEGKPLPSLNLKQTARKMGVVIQEHNTDFDFTVFDLVLMGRTPHHQPWERDSDEDYQIVEKSLNQVGISSLKNRIFSTLSGGEKQLVLIARALAQQAVLLILDEPTNHLDIYYQLEILQLVHSLPITKLAALHDLNMAAQFCEYLYFVNHGYLIASGYPQDVLKPALIRDVFGVKAIIGYHPTNQKPYLFFQKGKNIYDLNIK